jgi:WD40 repeat protein
VSHNTGRSSPHLIPSHAALLILIVFASGGAAPIEQPGRFLGRLEGAVSNIAFSPDGSRIVTCADRDVRVWDARSLAKVAGPFQSDTLSGNVSFSPDATRLVTDQVQPLAPVFDARSGNRLLTLPHGKSPAKPSFAEGNINGVHAVAFSHDGRMIVTGGDDRTARLWDASTGKELRVLQHEGTVWFVAFSPDDTRVATVTYGFMQKTDFMRPTAVRVWDTGNGRELWRKTAAQFSRGGVSFSSDGKRLAGTLLLHRPQPDGAPDLQSLDERLFVWDAGNGVEHLNVPPPASVGRQVAVSFARDGRRLLAAGTQGVALLDAGTGNLASPAITAGHCQAILSPGETLILTGGPWGRAALWDAGSGERLLDLRAGKMRKDDQEVNDTPAIAFSPDGRRFAVGYPLEDYTVVREIEIDPKH